MKCSWCAKPIENENHIFAYKQYYHANCHYKKIILDNKYKKGVDPDAPEIKFINRCKGTIINEI